MLGTLPVFTSPGLLGFLVLLPLIWWLLRLTPPVPKKVPFPALSLLQNLVKPEQTPAQTPWWLLLLRLLIAALVIIAFAGPVINPEAVISGKGALLVAVDNDWAAARDWDARQQQLHDIIRSASRDNRQILLLPTTAPANGEALQITGPVAAKAALADIERLKPQPWPASWQEAAKLVQALPGDSFSDSIWLSGSTGGVDAGVFYNAMRDRGDVRTYSDPKNPVYVLMPPQSEGDNVVIAAMRAVTDDAATVGVAAMDRSGHVLAHLSLLFPAGAPRATTPLAMPLDIRNQVARFEIEGQRSAATTALLDASWEHRPLGIIGDKTELDKHSLLSGLFYIDRALVPYADIHIGALDDLLKQPMAVIVMPGDTDIATDQIKPLSDWIKKGGTLIRFAGDRLAGDDIPDQDDLLPVTLRSGDRSMGGTLSWATPQKLQDFPANSPFHGLEIPADVAVSRQILAEPSDDLAKHVWASLADGTPLVTYKSSGQGLTVLFHVPARSDWSNLPLSGLFVDMLRRVVDLSHSGAAGRANFTTLPPLRALDAFGETQKPDAAAQAISSNDLAQLKPGPEHPPGIYGTDTLNRAFNLGPAIGQPEMLRDIPAQDYHPEAGQTDLGTALLLAALLLILFDFGLSLYLRGLLVRRVATTAAFILALMLSSHAGAAQQNAVELTARTTLAYIQTGNRETDHISELGLAGLARMLENRTSMDEVAVTGVDPDRDELAFFPLLYWPLVNGEAPLTAEGARHVNDYLHHGGMILFDSMNGEMLSPAVLQHILAGVDLPPLQKLPENHVLKRSFYLLDSFPGRYANDNFWLEPEEASSYDGVATVLSGTNGWAAAWAADSGGHYLYPCVPGGEQQRERAFRFGVNIVMYALTGNYKNDQLHAQALLKRMGK